jgi:hypothetical protein
VSADALQTGPNTIRVCVTDESGTGSDTTTVTKTGSAPPAVTIVSAVPSTIGPSQTSTLTWHADQNGSFSVRVGGEGCSDGTQIASGSYSTSPSDVTTTVHGSDLSHGANTVRVCVTNDSEQTGSDETTVTLDDTAPTFSNVPSPAPVEATGPNGAVVTYTNPTASDVDERRRSWSRCRTRRRRRSRRPAT